MMYSSYNINKQGDNIQPWHTPFPIWNQSVVSCPVLTVASWPAYSFLKRQVRWSGIPISFRWISALLKERTQSSLIPAPRTQWEGAEYESGRRPSPEPEDADTFIMDFLASRTGRNKFLLFNPLNFWYFVRRVWADWQQLSSQGDLGIQASLILLLSKCGLQALPEWFFKLIIFF